MAEKKRLDAYIVEQGLCESREKAKAAIMAGDVYVNGQKALKAGDTVKETDQIEVRGGMEFVSRGGYKLKKAMAAFPIVLTGKVSLERVVEALTAGPRRAFRLAGGLLPGAPADLVVIDPDAAWTVDPADFLSLGKATPFAGKAVRGRILLTLKDGKPVYQA